MYRLVCVIINVMPYYISLMTRLCVAAGTSHESTSCWSRCCLGCCKKIAILSWRWHGVHIKRLLLCTGAGVNRMKLSPRKFGNSTQVLLSAMHPHQYTLRMVEQQLLQYFLSIQQKGYGLSLHYKDPFVGEVKPGGQWWRLIGINFNDTEGLYKRHEMHTCNKCFPTKLTN